MQNAEFGLVNNCLVKIVRSVGTKVRVEEDRTGRSELVAPEEIGDCFFPVAYHRELEQRKAGGEPRWIGRLLRRRKVTA